jgi:elongation factor G
LKDGAFHAVDSSELAFRLAAIGAFREAFKQAAAIMLEPVMTVEVVAPSEFQSTCPPPLLFSCSGPDRHFFFGAGQVIGGLNTRRGTIVDSEVRDDEFTAVAEVALNDMFGYSNQLRGSTQGKGEFSMEYKVRYPHSLSFSVLLLIQRSLLQHHMPVLPNVQKELEEAYKKTLNQGKK